MGLSLNLARRKLNFFCVSPSLWYMEMLSFLCSSVRHKVVLLLYEDTNNEGNGRAEPEEK